jgi:glycolate oxidase FAD binding subunit
LNLQSPTTAEELAGCLREAASRGDVIHLGGTFTKDRMGGAVVSPTVRVSTAAMRRVIQYEPNDLTVSVEAGLPWRELTALLEARHQMIPLDPPEDEGTVGGVIGANVSGPRRRWYGTARDVVIGMQFATLEGKLVETGGMVVKNVAGLDMGKLMIGSFGTLAAMASVNFKLNPMPAMTRTFEFSFAALEPAVTRRDALLKSQLAPAAIDIERTGAGWRLLVQAGGSAKLIARYEREMAGAKIFEGDAERALWRAVRRFPLEHGAIVRVSCELMQVRDVLAALPGAALARAGNGVVYGAFENWRAAAEWMKKHPGTALIESSNAAAPAESLWPVPGEGFATMEKLKMLFDPRRQLNPGRLYGRI